jgi:hypothetical protein
MDAGTRLYVRLHFAVNLSPVAGMVRPHLADGRDLGRVRDFVQVAMSAGGHLARGGSVLDPRF